VLGITEFERSQGPMSRKKISTTIYVTPEQSERLRLLHERTKVPVAVYIREGIDLVLREYVHLLPGQLPLDVESPASPTSSRLAELQSGRLVAEGARAPNETRLAEMQTPEGGLDAGARGGPRSAPLVDAVAERPEPTAIGGKG